MLHEITLDTKKEAFPVRITVRAGEKGSCAIKATITANGNPYDLTGCTARFECVKPDLTMVRDAATVSGSTITYTMATEAMSAVGTIKTGYFAIIKGSTVVETTGNVCVKVLPSAEVSSVGLSGHYVPEIDDMIAEMTQAKALQLAATNDANKSAAAANTATGNANAATSASGEATAACIVATNAANALLDASTITNDDIRSIIYKTPIGDSLGTSRITEGDLRDMIYGKLVS